MSHCTTSTSSANTTNHNYHEERHQLPHPLLDQISTTTAFRSISSATTTVAAAIAVTSTITASASATTSTNSSNAPQQAPSRYSHGRKTSLSIAGDSKLSASDKKHSDQMLATTALQDGEQPAKVFKVFKSHHSGNKNNNLIAPLNSSELNPMSLVASSGSLVVSPYTPQSSTTAAIRSQPPPHLQKVLMNGGNGVITTSELGRLPGGAELNILPAAIAATNGNESAVINGSSAAAAAFFHANGKLTLLNNGNISHAPGGCGSNGILLKASEHQHPPTFSLSNGNILQLTPATAASLQLGGLTPMFVATAAVSHTNGSATQFAAGNDNNFAQLLAAATAAGGNQTTTSSLERFNGSGGKVSTN